MFANLILANVSIESHVHGLNVAKSLSAIPFNGDSNGITFEIDEKLSMDVIMDTLKKLGPRIIKLSIHYKSFSAWESKNINEQISKYVIKSLIEIELNEFAAKLNGLSGPFDKVESIQFRWGFGQTNDINLSTVFPMVRTINVDKIKWLGRPMIEHHFPRLESLREASLEDVSDELESVLRLNPQLKQLRLHQGDCNFLRRLSKILPHINSLELYRFIGGSSIEGDDIHLEQLKVFMPFTMIDFQESAPQLPIIFGNLEEIAVYNLYRQLFEITIKNKHLKKVTFHHLSNEHLQRIAAELPELQIFRTAFYVNSVNAVNEIVRFIETAKRLKVINLWKCAQPFQSQIFRLIQNEWEMITEEYDDYVTFVRRQSRDQQF